LLEDEPEYILEDETEVSLPEDEPGNVLETTPEDEVETIPEKSLEVDTVVEQQGGAKLHIELFYCWQRNNNFVLTYLKKNRSLNKIQKNNSITET
jgi:hypothetical protein